jgi:hypothetical protein
MRTQSGLTLFAAAALLGACGGTDNGTGGGTCTPGPTASFSIMAAGLTPKAVCVLPGTGTVTFRNDDTAAHDIEDSGTTCPQLNLGVIAAGATRTTVAFPTATVCQFHDQLAPTNTAFQGTVAVTTGQVGGPGY